MADVGFYTCAAGELFYGEQTLYETIGSYYNKTESGSTIYLFYMNNTGSLYCKYGIEGVTSIISRTVGAVTEYYKTEVTNSNGTNINSCASNDKFYIVVGDRFTYESIYNIHSTTGTGSDSSSTSFDMYRDDNYYIDVNGKTEYVFAENIITNSEFPGLISKCHIRRVGERPVYIYSMSLFNEDNELPKVVLYGIYYRDKHYTRAFYEHEIFGEDYDKPLVKISDELYNKGLCGRLYADCALSISKQVVVDV